MNEREIIEQLEGLIEAWQLNEADLNQTDINAIKQMLDKNKKLKEQLEEERKARKEAIEFINGTGEMAPYTKSIVMYEQEIEELLNILDIDKGE